MYYFYPNCSALKVTNNSIRLHNSYLAYRVIHMNHNIPYPIKIKTTKRLLLVGFDYMC